VKLNLNPIVVASPTTPNVAIPADTRSNPTNIGVRVTATAGTYQVYITLDDVYAAGYTSTAGNWFIPAAGQFTGTLSGTTFTGTSIGNITVLCTAVQLQVTAGTATIQAWQTDSTQGA
jgi:hypothetical protein